MAPSKSSSHLMKVGLEGFAMLDEFKQHNYRRQPQKPQVKVFTPVPAAVEYRVDCYEAARFYGGIVIADYPKNNMIKKPSSMP